MCDINKVVTFIIKIANDNAHGYDQQNRNSPDYDCSSLVAVALNQAGFKVNVNSWTGNLETQLRKCGFTDCTKPWKAGDIHLNVREHVCMSINESQIAQACINEYGEVIGGKTGDQTGNEINISNYYEYPTGWNYHLRYTGNAQTTATKSVEEIAKEVIAGKWSTGDSRKQKLESAGYNYNTVQAKVNRLLSR